METLRQNATNETDLYQKQLRNSICQHHYCI